MKTILAKSPHDSSLSLSKRYFNWRKKIQEGDDDDSVDEAEILTRFNSSSSDPTPPDSDKKKTVSKLRYALTLFNRNRFGYSYSGLGTRVVGTLFGNRRGHVHFAVQDDPTRLPAVLIELPTPTSVLVREMASGLVRIALECEKKIDSIGMTKKEKKKLGLPKKLLEEPTWRTYCNGKKCGFAARREVGAAEWKVLTAVGRITMGAGVLPATAKEGEEEEEAGSEMGELMYMRARFERVVGSRDSEAFYMMSPEGANGGPELSVYFLRV
ncbi:PREDICTED: protein MIZU-KUSSEI 1 [Tarenaya hassleriana]|uniref:protein MIZU-KUSSEI 1 n=1 Tax=Tarenaya hassleriana TaxID=28532 RepID=UPI00053C97DA|nr:PREDICTED: protein MIZU-KUSSEI 1 [Tarenaya hassleriana]